MRPPRGGQGYRGGDPLLCCWSLQDAGMGKAGSDAKRLRGVSRGAPREGRVGIALAQAGDVLLDAEVLYGMVSAGAFCCGRQW